MSAASSRSAGRRSSRGITRARASGPRRCTCSAITARGKSDSDGFLAQATYKFGDLKVGLNYGVSNLDLAPGELPSDLVKQTRSTRSALTTLTENLTLLAEFTDTTAEAHNGIETTAATSTSARTCRSEGVLIPRPSEASDLRAMNRARSRCRPSSPARDSASPAPSPRPNRERFRRVPRPGLNILRTQRLRRTRRSSGRRQCDR